MYYYDNMKIIIQIYHDLHHLLNYRQFDLGLENINEYLKGSGVSDIEYLHYLIYLNFLRIFDVAVDNETKHIAQLAITKIKPYPDYGNLILIEFLIDWLKL